MPLDDAITDELVIKEFLVESYESLDKLDREFLALEADPQSPQRLGAIFRTVHTIKGTSGFLGYGRLEGLTHAGESLLSELRAGTVALTPDRTSALLALFDQVRGYLHCIETEGSEGTADSRALAERVLQLAKDEVAAATPPAEPPAALPPAEISGAAPVEAVADVASIPTPGRGEGDQPLAGSMADSTLRVDVGLLDRLMNLVGELVLTRNQVLQFPGVQQDPQLRSTSQRLNLITTELQAEVMKTRMQPIGTVWNKLPRVVRDLMVHCGKQVRVEMIGKETELDRSIIEAIKDPLTHIVRNAVDHGFETPEARAVAGKPRTGTLTLRAFHEGGRVNIEIADDGGGIDAQLVKQKALQSGAISAERAARLNEGELRQLVFLPGFSTAKKVTKVSGRGVGMDVVKTNIEKIGGTVELQSQVGRGTILKIKIPLTLAIVPALMVTSRGQRFAIPQVSLLELVRVEGAGRQHLDRVHGAAVYRLRGSLLPLVDLAATLRLRDRRPPRGPEQQAAEAEVTSLVVLQAEGRRFGLIVDEIRDTEEIVVKPLGKELQATTVFAGATVMGDGRVALILDVLGLVQKAGGLAGDRRRDLGEASAATSLAAAVPPRQMRLLCRANTPGCLALPLAAVGRLEEFPRGRIERLGQSRAVRYRGQILPLIDLGEAVGQGPVSAGEPRTTVPTVVFTENGRSVGLLVGEILDIVEDTGTLETEVARPWVLGACLLQGRLAELVDVPALIQHQLPGLLRERAA